MNRKVSFVLFIYLSVAALVVAAFASPSQEAQQEVEVLRETER